MINEGTLRCQYIEVKGTESWSGGGGRWGRRMVASAHPLSYVRLLKNLFNFSS